MPATESADKETNMHPVISGSEAVAWGLIEAGVQYVTGHPGSPESAIVDVLVRLVQAAGAENVRVVDPNYFQETQKAYEEGLEADGVSVVIIRHPCTHFVSEIPHADG